MKTIAVVTATRAEYGLLRPLIKRLEDNNYFAMDLLVTGTHLLDNYGMTIKEIENDQVHIDAKIDIICVDEGGIDVSSTMAKALSSFSLLFKGKKYDAVVVLGDRYEILAVTCAAYNCRIPIIHLCGGDTTEGALDEAYRHSITKMSCLHFTTNEFSKKRVIQLGESPNRVFNVGSLGIENIKSISLLTLEELKKEISFELSEKYAVVTFHPTTLVGNSSKRQCMELIQALTKRTDLQYIITKSNADEEGDKINEIWDEFAKKNKNIYLTASMGVKKYLSAISHAKMVIGNSSSGIGEVPSFHVPTVNIGDRQRGRLHGKSVIDCEPVYESILQAMTLAENKDFLNSIRDEESVYGDGNTSEKIISILEDFFRNDNIKLMKKFYDIGFEI